MIYAKLDATWLTGDLDSAPYRTATNVQIDGSLISQDVHNVGATDLLLYARGGASTSLAFDVLEEFASDRAAQKAALIWRVQYPSSGVLTLYLGNATDGYEVLQAPQCTLQQLVPQLGGITMTRSFSLKVSALDYLYSIPGGETPAADIDGGAAFAPANSPPAQGTVDGGNHADTFDPADPLAITGGTFT